MPQCTQCISVMLSSHLFFTRPSVFTRTITLYTLEGTVCTQSIHVSGLPDPSLSPRWVWVLPGLYQGQSEVGRAPLPGSPRPVTLNQSFTTLRTSCVHLRNERVTAVVWVTGGETHGEPGNPQNTTSASAPCLCSVQGQTTG